MNAEKNFPGGWTVALMVMVVALIARLPVLGAYWNQDDWGLLARAAGMIPQPEIPIRWLSQTLYWKLLWPAAGLDPVPYAITRLLLHAAAAGGVVRLAWRLGLAPMQQWLAGLVMAATPLAFSPLYWAAGVQDLLAVACMVWSLERWLAGGRWQRLQGVLLALGALASKETVVGLPILLGWLLWQARGQDSSADPPARRDRGPWLLVALTLLAAAVAVWLALQFFATGQADAYALGGPDIMLGHLLIYGLWLLLPGPSYPPSPALALALLGGLLWLVWAGWGLHQWRRGRHVPLFSLLGAVTMLAPLLPLVRHLAPDLAYPVEPFGALALACLWPRRWRPQPVIIGGMLVLAMAWGFLGMRGRLSLREDSGQLADPLVRRTAVSADASRHLRQLPLGRRPLVLLQPPLNRQAAVLGDQLGEHWVTGSILYLSLGGTLGPRLLLADQSGDDPTVQWANSLRRTPQEALVLTDAGERFLPWGDTRQALLYLTLTDLGLGHFERARRHLLRASLLAGEVLSIAYHPDLLPVAPDQVLANLPAFHAYLDRAPDIVGVERTGLQANILQLVSVCTNRTPDELETLVRTTNEEPSALERP